MLHMMPEHSQTKTLTLAELRREFDRLSSEITGGHLYDLKSTPILGGTRWDLTDRRSAEKLGAIVIRLQQSAVIVTWWKSLRGAR